MTDKFVFTTAEKEEALALYTRLKELLEGNLMAGDEEIIRLRSQVRKAAESKLQHGIIDVNDLVREINAENTARVQQTMHEIEMLKEIYDQQFSAGGPYPTLTDGE